MPARVIVLLCQNESIMAKKNYHIKLKGYVGGWNFDANYVDYMLDKHKDEEVHVHTFGV